MIPLICTIRFNGRGARRNRVWIPLFLLWPFIIALFAVVELFVVLGCAVLLFIRTRAAFTIAAALPAALYVLLQASGLSMEITGPGQPEVQVELS